MADYIVPVGRLGSFPSAGPVTYLSDDPDECRRMMAGPYPHPRTWYHGTTERIARLACVQGIAPGCWLGTGGKCCGVLGYDALGEFLLRRQHLWILEIAGPALDGDIKAWWVPYSDVRGVWHLDHFVSRAEFARANHGALTMPKGGCECGLSEICAEQQVLWRKTWGEGAQP